MRRPAANTFVFIVFLVSLAIGGACAYVASFFMMMRQWP